LFFKENDEKLTYRAIEFCYNAFGKAKKTITL